MRELVAAEVAVAAEDFATTRALEGPDVGVSEKMCLKIRSLVESAAALRAFVRRVVQMQDSVNGESPRLTEAFAAVVAFEGLFLRVNVSEGEKASEMRGVFAKREMRNN